MFNGIPIQPAPALQQAGVNLTPATEITQALATLPFLFKGLFGSNQNQNQQQNPQGIMGNLANGATPAQTPAQPAAVPAAAPTAAPATAGQMTVGAPYQPNTGYTAKMALPGQLPITGLGQAGLGMGSGDLGVLGQLLLRARQNQNPFMQPPGGGFASGLPSLTPGQAG